MMNIKNIKLEEKKQELKIEKGTGSGKRYLDDDIINLFRRNREYWQE